MPKIIWNESFSVGVKALDEHHCHLAKLINSLSDNRSEAIGSERVVDIVSELVQYAMYHFDHEEQLMAKHGYPMLPNHRAGHTQFCEVISETNYGGVLGIIEVSDLTDYLIRWWKSHILLEDMQYKPFFTEKGVN